MSDFGREPVQIIEIDQTFCGLEYGVGDCEAAIGVTGNRKCYNTFSTCQDRLNFLKEFLTLRFVTKGSNIPKEWNAIPSLVNVSTTPTVLNIGGRSGNSGPLGTRAALTATFQDHPDGDIFTDPYLNDRDFDPIERSTFWAKWLARNKFYKNRAIRLYEGYIGQSLAEMQVKHYVIETIEGPSNGSVTIKAYDVLRLADDDKAQAPSQSTGVLTASLNDSATSFKVAGAVLADYPAPGTVRINDELISYSAVALDGDDVEFTVTSRGTDGTEADSHDEGDSVQLCLRYTDQDVWLVIQDLLENYAGVNPDFIPIADWTEEGETWLESFEVTTLITEPTGVLTLLNEISEQCLVYIWWDERRQEIRLRSVRAPTEQPVLLNDTANILEGSFAKREDPNDLRTQIWFYYQPRNATEIGRDQDFRNAIIRRDADAESENEHDESRIKKIYSRWLRTGAQVTVTLTRLLDQFRDPSVYSKFSMDAKDRGVWTGDIVDIDTRDFVNDTGAREPKRYIIISADEVESGHRVNYEALEYEFITGNGAFWMAEDAPDYSAASDSEKEAGAWWSDEDGLIDGDEGYVWQ